MPWSSMFRIAAPKLFALWRDHCPFDLRRDSGQRLLGRGIGRVLARARHKQFLTAAGLFFHAAVDSGLLQLVDLRLCRLPVAEGRALDDEVIALPLLHLPGVVSRDAAGI